MRTPGSLQREMRQIAEDHPALAAAFRGGKYWRLPDGGVAFEVKAPNDPDLIRGFEAMAKLLDMPLDHLAAGTPPTPRPPGRPMNFDEFTAGDPPCTTRSRRPTNLVRSGLV